MKYNINTVTGIIKYRKPILYLTARVFKIVRNKIRKQTKKMILFIFNCEENWRKQTHKQPPQ